MFENRKNSLFETQLKWVDFQNEEDRKLIDSIELPENVHFTNYHNYTVYNDELKALIKNLNRQNLSCWIVFRCLFIKNSYGYV